MPQPVMLIIRDGWGINPHGRQLAEADGNATLLAKTPYHDALYQKYPWSRLSASGMDVGLPEGQMGNSEVGHLNLGAGRIVYQDFTRINKAILDGELSANPGIQQAFAIARDSRLHFIGLLSDGGVHSHQDHLIALVKEAAKCGVKEILIHAITDGRDTSPTGGAEYISTVESAVTGTGAIVSTVIGRYFAMDRDKRWERTKLAWDAIVLGQGEIIKTSPAEAVRGRYQEGETDEFLKPLIFSHPNQQRIRDDDVVFFFNFRADRGRQLSRPFLFDDFKGFDRQVQPRVHFVTMTVYDETFNCPAAFQPQTLDKILGEVVSAAGKKQLRIAETEKYPHVTYFFNGGVEVAFAGEDRVIIPSPKVATYDLMPEMSSAEVTAEVVHRLQNYDLIILNFANPDMVGHTGVVGAGIKAVETIDQCVHQVLVALLAAGGKALVTADHGNCELMRNPDGSPNTAHTTNLVHFIYVAANAGEYRLKDGILADVAPTLLELLGVTPPKEMTGHSLLEHRP
ncbi:MAG: 2,3-bisphosphoglycerate-independent phosphoglycerate mutase [Verrucomicrobiota bacterium]|jgi:2,3-bisphosphoglycerate-independent phosphoglycerate mutase|nr:2,3-bisphosphoglycerate-independent phosphoglycerate mutase [Verrucomicrobiota bacterium]